MNDVLEPPHGRAESLFKLLEMLDMENDKPVVNNKRTVPMKPHDGEWDDDGYTEPGLAHHHTEGPYAGLLRFACPGCGRIGAINVSSPKTPQSWLIEQLEPLTLSPSIHCIGCCGWHGFLTNGTFVSC